MAALLGTGIQLAAVGPQNKFLESATPGASHFTHTTQRSTRFASEDSEDLPLQTAGFGSTAIFEMPPRGDLLGHMHVQFAIPALQPELGVLTLRALPPVTGSVAPATTVSWGAPSFAVTLQGFVGATGTSQALRDGGTAWTFASGAERWEVAISSVAAGTYVVSTAVTTQPRTLTVTVGLHTTTMQHAVTGSLGLLVLPDGSVVAANDTWKSPLAYVLMRRAKFLVDDLAIHDHERLWYDLHDRLTLSVGQRAGLDELLGTGLSLGRAHTIMLPLKFMCCGQPRAYFPIILVPKCRVKVELHIEAFAACLETTRVPVAPPASLAVKLVAERVTLDSDERNAMLLRPLTLMYEGEQDMDGRNYTEGSDGLPRKTEQVAVDLSELNLPVRALVWVVYTESTPRLFEYVDSVQNATLLFGSLERATAEGPVFSRQQPWSHAPRCAPGNVHLYSFALQAWAKEPSGAVDFSLMQKPLLRLQLKPEAAAQQLKCKVFGVTYNWLTFQNGKVTRMFST